MSKKTTRKPLKLLPIPNTTEEVCESNAANRREIANKQLMALSVAMGICGFGHLAYGIWRMRDRTGAEPDRLIYTCRRKTEPGWYPPAPEGGEWDERVRPPFIAYGRTTETTPLDFGFRWECNFQYLEEYEPATADELKEALEKRKAKAEAENARRLAAEEAWRKRNETPSLYENLELTDL